MRQNVQKEAADKLLGRKGHLLGFVTICAIPVAECYETIFNLHNAMVGDCDSMSIPAEIIKDLPRAIE